MEWRLFATLAETAGDSRVSVDVSVDESADQPTVGDALDALVAAHPDLAGEVLDEDRTLADHVRLLHDGQDPRVSGNGLNEPVEPDDELALFPPVSGG